MSKVDRILAGTGPLTPSEQRTLVRAGAVVVNLADRITKNLDIDPRPEEALARRAAAQAKSRAIIAALTKRGTRTR